MIILKTPISEEQIRSLKVGDEVGITGIVFTGRDAVHKYLHEGGALPPQVNLRDGILCERNAVNWENSLREPFLLTGWF